MNSGVPQQRKVNITICILITPYLHALSFVHLALLTEALRAYNASKLKLSCVSEVNVNIKARRVVNLVWWLSFWVLWPAACLLGVQRTAEIRQRSSRLPFPSWLPWLTGRDTGADPPRRSTGVKRIMSSPITSLNSVSEARLVVAANHVERPGQFVRKVVKDDRLPAGGAILPASLVPLLR